MGNNVWRTEKQIMKISSENSVLIGAQLYYSVIIVSYAAWRIMKGTE